MSERLRPSRQCVAVLLAMAIPALAGFSQSSSSKDGKELIPGAKLLAKFPKEVYRVPDLAVTDKGVRLLVWVDASDPNPKPDFPGAPVKRPPFDLIVWDPAGNKELSKLASVADSAPQSSVPANWAPSSFGFFGMVALSPDGKRIAFVDTTYRMVPGKIVHEATREIKLYDIAKRKWDVFPKKYAGTTGGPHATFTPDGNLVVIKDAECTIVDPENFKPRHSFKIARGKGYDKHTVYSVFGVHDAVVSPDGASLAIAAEGLVTVYDIASGKELFRADRAAPEGDPGKGGGQATRMVSLAFAPKGAEPRLLTAEVVVGQKTLVLARLFDLKAKKEISRKTLADEPTKIYNFDAPQPWGGAHAYFTSKAEPRLIHNGKVFDGAKGKLLDQFDPGIRVLVAPDGKQLVRLARATDPKRMQIEAWSLENGK